MINVSLQLGKMDLPPGKNAGMFEVTMSYPGASDVVMTSPDGATLTFDALAAGTYSFVALRLDDNGDALSTLVSGSIDVPAPPPPPTQVDVPVSIVLSLA